MMKTLTEYNTVREQQRQERLRSAHLAGVLCDDCQVEMHYENVGWQNCSYPPGYWVICPQCQKRGLKQA